VSVDGTRELCESVAISWNITRFGGKIASLFESIVVYIQYFSYDDVILKKMTRMARENREFLQYRLSRYHSKR